MLNRLSVFLAIFLFLGGQCFYGIHGHEQEQQDQPSDDQTQNITGVWYAVMTTGCTDQGPCNIFTNNKSPCICIAAYFHSLQDIGWQVYMNALQNETGILTIDMGGASYEPSDSQTEIQGFTYSRATMQKSVLSASKYAITEKVIGSEFFLGYKISIIGSSQEFVYMITKITKIEGGDPLIVIWCRKRHPGKDTIWTKIVQNLKELSIDAHGLSFVSQDNCYYPSENQYNEIFFC